MDYRGYGLPISEVISEGNVGLMKALKRFEPEKGFRLSTYATWWIKVLIQEYILRSWSLAKMGTTANQKKLFFNLRKAKRRISALDEGDMRSDQVKTIAQRLGVTEGDVIYMNRRLSGDVSLNAPIREDGDFGEWQDWLVDERADQETTLLAREEFDNRHLAGVAPVFNPRYLDFAPYDGFTIAACNVARGNEKGRVESRVGYVKKSFLRGLELIEFSSIQAAAQVWLDTIANMRIQAAFQYPRIWDVQDSGRRAAERDNPPRSVASRRIAPLHCDLAVQNDR